MWFERVFTTDCVYFSKKASTRCDTIIVLQVIPMKKLHSTLAYCINNDYSMNLSYLLPFTFFSCRPIVVLCILKYVQNYTPARERSKPSRAHRLTAMASSSHFLLALSIGSMLITYCFHKSISK